MGLCPLLKTVKASSVRNFEFFSPFVDRCLMYIYSTSQHSIEKLLFSPLFLSTTLFCFIKPSYWEIHIFFGLRNLIILGFVGIQNDPKFIGLTGIQRNF